jgi:hypothetical protein
VVKIYTLPSPIALFFFCRLSSPWAGKKKIHRSYSQKKKTKTTAWGGGEGRGQDSPRCRMRYAMANCDLCFGTKVSRL